MISLPSFFAFKGRGETEGALAADAIASWSGRAFA